MRLLPGGGVDPAFNPGANLNGSVRAIKIQPDGKVLIGGLFTAYGATPRNYLARLLSDGTLDTFNVSTGPDDYVTGIDLQTDGRVVVVGNFTTFDGLARGGIARLRTDGTIDPSINFGFGANSFVDAVLLQPSDSKIVIGGGFTQFDNQPENRVARLNGGENLGSGILGFSTAGYSVNENAGNLTVTVIRSAGTSNSVQVVAQTAPGTALAGTDFTAVSTNLSFAVGQFNTSFTVPILDNLLADGMRLFTVGLATNASTAPALLGLTNATVTIVDNESLIGFSVAAFSQIENAGTATVTVTRTGGTNDAVSATFYTLNGTATSPANYTGVTNVLSFASGQTSTNIAITLVDDAVVNSDRTVLLRLTNFTSSALPGLTNATLTIIDNESGPGQITFSAAAYAVAENAGSITISVLRTNGNAGPASASFATFAGGANPAVAGSHYTSTNGLFNWASGDTSVKTFAVAITDDGATNVDRTVGLRLTGITGSSAGFTNVVLTIADNDSVITFTGGTYSVNENQATAPITVNRTGNLTNTATVTFYTLNGTAIHPTHYTGVTNTLTFNPLVASVTASVPLVNDSAVNVDRTFNVGLISPSPAASVALGIGGATVTIVNEDVDLQFSLANYSVAEAGGSATITVNRTGLVTGASTVDFATTGGSAVQYLDYSPTNGTLSFTAGQLTKTFTVPVYDNTATNANRTVTLALSNPTGSASTRLGAINTATLTITDDDLPVAAGTSDVAFAPGLNGTVFTVKQYPAGASSGGSAIAALLTNNLWIAQGPTPARNGQVEGIVNGEVSGAVNRVLPHPSNPAILYLGAVNGGLWKSINAQAASPTWTPLTDTLGSLSVGALAFDTTDATGNTLIVGVGRSSSLAELGGPRTGLQISTNAGSSFVEVDGSGRLTGLNIRGVVKRGNTIVISVDKADVTTAANVGVFRSTDGGTNFTQISSGDGSVTGIPAGRRADLVGDPTTPTTLYVGVFNAALFGPGANGVFKSTDFGASWIRISDAAVDAALTATVDNIKLAAGPSASVYAAIADNGRCSAVFRSGNGGAVWTLMDLPTTQETGIPANGTVGIHPGGQGQKHFSLCVDPTNPNIVYIAGDRQPQGFQDTGSFPNTVGANNYTARMFRGDASQAVAASGCI